MEEEFWKFLAPLLYDIGDFMRAVGTELKNKNMAYILSCK